MNEIDKKIMRKSFGLNDMWACEDPSILKRRKIHIAAACWLARWMYYLQALFLMIGLFFFLLPAFGLDWYLFVIGRPATYVLSDNFSVICFGFFFLFMSGTVLNIILSFNSKYYPGGWNPTEQFGFPNPKQVVELELYPRNKKEEFVFWVDYIFGILVSTWPLLVIGLLAFFVMR